MPCPAGAAGTSHDDKELRFRVDGCSAGAPDRPVRRVYVGLLVSAFLSVACMAGSWHCELDVSGSGCGSLRWVAVTLRRQNSSQCGGRLCNTLPWLTHTSNRVS